MTSFIQKAFRHPILAAFGNPLLDVHVLTDENLLHEFNLEVNGLKEVPYEEFSSISNAVSEKYAYHDIHPTGMSYCFATGDNRCCVAHVGAAGVYRVADLDAPENWTVLNDVLLVYVEGFFICHDFLTTQKLVEFCDAKGTGFALNLSAPYVCRKFSSEVTELLIQADFIFGNKQEYFTLCEVLQWDAQDVKDIIAAVRNMNQSSRRHKKKQLPTLLREGPVIVVTQGEKSVIALQGSGETAIEFAVPKVESSAIKDTTGAGDAFVAGFLAAALADFDLDVCVMWGCWTAQQIIQQVGVAIPSYPPEGLFVPQSTAAMQPDCSA